MSRLINRIARWMRAEGPFLGDESFHYWLRKAYREEV